MVHRFRTTQALLSKLMIRLPLAFATIYCLFSLHPVCSGSPDLSTGELSQEFQRLATLTVLPQPWHRSTLTASEQQAVLDLRSAANKIMARDDYSEYVLSLLNERMNSDDQVRQELIRAIVNTSRGYTRNDIPFLRSVFLASFGFHYDDQPTRMPGWYTADDLRSKLSNHILGVTGRKELIGNADMGMLFSDPMAWLNKYAPN